MHHAFSYTFFLLSLHDNDVKMPNFVFFRGREQKTMTFFKFLMTSRLPYLHNM